MTERRLRVLWIHHSAVVDEWRRGRVRALAEEGIDVTVVSARRWNEGGALVELAAARSESVVPTATVGTHPYLFAYDPRPIRRALRAERFDVVDAHEEPASIALAEIIVAVDAARAGTPIVCYSAQNLLKKYPPPFRWLEQRALRRIAAVHSCNEDVEDVLRAKGFAGEVANIGLGVDPARFPPGPSGTVEPRARTLGRPLQVGYIGRLEERKGIFTLLAAVHTLEGVSLGYVGSGPDAQRLQDAIVARDMGDGVTVRGFVGHDDLSDVYRGLDVLAVPSITTTAWTEQFGRVVVEAMASGIPVIVSDAGALPEVVADAGVVVPEDDARALADAIADLRDDPARCVDLTEAGWRRAQHFSWECVGHRQAELYRRVVGR